MPRSDFAGVRLPPDVSVLAVRWYLRFGLSYRDVEELLTERGSRSTCHRLPRVLRSRRCWPTPPTMPHTVGDRWQWTRPR
jgi:hypothetical protein